MHWNIFRWFHKKNICEAIEAVRSCFLIASLYGDFILCPLGFFGNYHGAHQVLLPVYKFGDADNRYKVILKYVQ